MPAKSSIESKLTKEQITLLNKHVVEGTSVRELMDWVEHNFDVRISNGAMGRHSKHIREISDKMRQTREAAEVIASKLGDTADTTQGRMLIEMLQTILFKFFHQSIDGDTMFDTKEFSQLAKSIKDLSHAQALDANREIQIKEKILSKAEIALEEKVEGGGISAETASEILKAMGA